MRVQFFVLLFACKAFAGAQASRYVNETRTSYGGSVTESQRNSVESSRSLVRVETLFVKDKTQILHQERRLILFQSRPVKGLKGMGGEVHQIIARAPYIRLNGSKATGTIEYQPKASLNIFSALGVAQMHLGEFQNIALGLQRDFLLYKIRTNFRVLPKTELRFESSNDFAYVGWRNDAGDAHIHAAHHVFVEVDSNSLEKWQMRVNTRRIFFGDRNEQQITDGLILRSIWTEPFIFRAGMGGGWVTFNDQHPGYWSPASFQNYDLRIVVVKKFSDKFKIETRLSYGLRRHNSDPHERERAAEIHLSYDNQSGWLLKLAGNFYVVNNGDWWRDDVFLSMQWQL